MEPLNESGIKHRLFGKNNSTATHWYPRHGVPVPVTELHINHVAAIIDLYEGEAVKFLTEHISAPSVKLRLTEFDKRRAPIVDRFLRKNVPAWAALKNREKVEKLTNHSNWIKLFLNRDYRVNKAPKPIKTSSNVGGGKTDKISFDIETYFRTPGVAYPKFTQHSFAQYWDGPKFTPEKKAQLNLQVVKAKIAVINALTDLQEWIDKNL